VSSYVGENKEFEAASIVSASLSWNSTPQGTLAGKAGRRWRRIPAFYTRDRLTARLIAEGKETRPV